MTSDGTTTDRNADPTDRNADPADRVVKTYRGISPRLIRHYLTNLGGEVRSDDRVVGDGWEVRLSAGTVRIGPSIELTEVEVVFEGDPEALGPLVERFAQKAMRAGG